MCYFFFETLNFFFKVINFSLLCRPISFFIFVRGLSRSDSSRSPSPVRRQPPRRSPNLLKFKIATFYTTDVELWFIQIKTHIDLHQITDDDERYRLTCAALSGEDLTHRQQYVSLEDTDSISQFSANSTSPQRDLTTYI